MNEVVFSHFRQKFLRKCKGCTLTNNHFVHLQDAAQWSNQRLYTSRQKFVHLQNLSSWVSVSELDNNIDCYHPSPTCQE